jgi:hypothetical protein
VRLASLWITIVFTVAVWLSPWPARGASTADVQFVLSAPVSFFGSAPIRGLGKTEASRLLDAPVDGAGSVRYIRDGRPERRVATCREFGAAQRDGFDPATNTDNKLAGFFERACGLLLAVRLARRATKSFVDQVTMSDIAALSSAALPGLPWEPARPAPAARAGRRRISVATFIRRQGCKVVWAKPLELRLRCADMMLALQELFRADVDGDGIQDIVISPSVWSTDGTFSYTGADEVLTRTSAHGLLLTHPLR